MRSQKLYRLLVLFSLCALLASGACTPKPRPAMSTPVVLLAGTCKATQQWARGFQADSCWLGNGDLPPIQPDLWPDVCTSAFFGWFPSQASFDQLSWRTFLYAVWPANPINPGTPDKGQPIGGRRRDGAFLPTVWETFRSTDDLFNPGGEVPAGCSADGPRVLSMTSKVPSAAFHAVAGAGLLDSLDPALSSPLVDQNGNLVYYEIRINELEHSAILQAGAQKKSPDELNCTGDYKKDCTPFVFPVGSMEVKAAWKQLSDEEVKSGKFYSQPFRIQTPDGQCPTVTMGLVGLHINHKTPLSSQSSPSWVWSTFEHVDNVPGSSGGPYSFFDPSCSPRASAALCATAASQHDRSAPEYACCTNLDRYPSGTLPAHPAPSQITRLDDRPQETQSCNDVYAQTQRGIWDHYSLVSTQWPQTGEDAHHSVVATPAHLRNTVIESYHAKWVNEAGQQPKQINMSSCMGCHSKSHAVDMSYLFLGNVSSR